MTKKHYHKPAKDKKLLFYGRNCVMAAINNPERDIIGIYSNRQDDEIITAAKARDIPVHHTERDTLNHMVGDVHHQGIVCQLMPLPTLSLSDWLKQHDTAQNNTESASPIRFAMLDQLNDPQNIGAILRSAHIFGLNGIIISHHHSPKESALIAHIASGAYDYVPVFYVTNLVKTITMLQQYDIWSIALDGDAKRNIQEIASTHNMLYVLGAEGKGIRPLVKQHCDFHAKISMADNHIGSLNVSNAAAIVFHHFSMIASS